jgi:5-methylcytosine-specific restriction endonuclease McrA
MVLHRDPICRACGRAASMDVDHIVPVARGGLSSMENLQGLCHACHALKTALVDGGFGRSPAPAAGTG